MRPNEIPGAWRVVANGSPATLQLWLVNGGLSGQIKFDGLPAVETLTNASFSWDLDHNWGLLQFGRPQAAQQYTGRVRQDDVRGTFTQGGSSFSWFGCHVPSPLAGLTSERPRVQALDHRAGPPGAPRVLVIVEERLLGSLLASFTGGNSALTRYFDDLQSEGWEVVAYRYDVRSHETGERAHRHLPSEFLDLHRFVRSVYEAAQGVIAGVMLIGDF